MKRYLSVCRMLRHAANKTAKITSMQHLQDRHSKRWLRLTLPNNGATNLFKKKILREKSNWSKFELRQLELSFFFCCPPPLGRLHYHSHTCAKVPACEEKKVLTRLFFTTRDQLQCLHPKKSMLAPKAPPRPPLLKRTSLLPSRPSSSPGTLVTS